MSPERAGYASMERTRSFHEEGGKGEEEGGWRVLRKYSRTFFERFHARLPVLVGELSRSMEPEIGVTCDESQGGCGCRGGCLLTLRGHRYCFGGLGGVNTLGVKRIEWDKGGYR